MKVEIRKIGIMNVLFSVFPVAVFVIRVVSGILGMFGPDSSFTVSFLMSMIMTAILNTLLFLVYTVVFLGVYNILCGIGIRGIRIVLEDKE